MSSTHPSTIYRRLMTAGLAFIAIVAGIAATAIWLQLNMASRAATLEAEHVANAIAGAAVALDRSGESPDLQRLVSGLGSEFHRDLFIVDTSGKVIASTNAARIGSRYLDDGVTRTLQDGAVRAFRGADVTEPGLADQVVVPMRGSANAPITGAVVFEYSVIYETLMRQARATAWFIFALALSVTVALAVFGRRTARAIVSPIQRLREGVRAIAGGDFGARVHVATQDEVGALASAFNRMASEVEAGRTELSSRAELLAEANARLGEELEKLQQAGERIEYLAYNDSLTGLPNRSMFSQLLVREIAHSVRYGHAFAVLFIDLDRFKQINDTLGHAAGDLLLQETARRLQDTVQDGDVVARMGGDEFVVVLPRLEGEGRTEAVAQRILNAVSRPLSLGGQELRITSSIGIALYPEHGRDEQSLMKHADVAMYHAKENGKNAFQHYSSELDRHSLERLALESSLRRALSRRELEVYYQPKIDLQTGRVAGMEALLRWKHPDLGMISPLQFIPIAEETGLIVPIGRWVLQTACQQAALWRRKGLGDLMVAVNLSARQFSEDHLQDHIVQALQDAGLPATALELEITESMIMQDAARARAVLLRLKALGIRIAIDDFGTGYSSLSNLKEFPIDTLKIDRSFIGDLATNPEDRGITEAIIAMGKTLGLDLVAEGVESEQQAAILRELACDQSQGYLFSPPVPAAAFEKLVRKQQQAGETLLLAA